MPIIEFKNVKKSFGEKKILDGLDLAVEQGETLTILGGSGSGKSVSLKLLMGLIEVDDGEICFKGEDITKMDEHQLMTFRRNVGMVFQGSALFDSISVYENIAYPLRVHFDYKEKKIEEIVSEKLSLVGLDGTQEMYPADLSGGMRKRIGLARAIATDPDVILYDEPTAGLDPSNTNRVSNLILNLQKILKVTSIVVTHEMNSAFKISNRIALLHNKHIEYIGSVDEVKNTPNSIVRDFINGEMKDI